MRGVQGPFHSAVEAPFQLALVDRALERWGVRRVGEPSAVPDSVQNDNIRVETDASTRFLRFHKENRTRARLLAEHRVLRWVAARGLPVVEPLAGEGGGTVFTAGGRLVALFPWVEGAHLERGRLDRAGAALLGDTLGRLHTALAAYPRRGLRTGGIGTSWDTDTSIATLARVDDVIRYYPAPGEERLRAQEALREQLALLEAPGLTRPSSDFAALTVQPCHGDFHERNVLVRDGELVAVVDWEAFGLIPPVFEVIRAMEFSRIVLDEALARAFLGAYAGRRRLTALECELGPEIWWQSSLHDTWVFSAVFIQGNSRVERFLAEKAPLLRRWSDSAYRARVAELLAAHASV